MLFNYLNVFSSKTYLNVFSLKCFQRKSLCYDNFVNLVLQNFDKTIGPYSFIKFLIKSM